MEPQTITPLCTPVRVLPLHPRTFFTALFLLLYISGLKAQDVLVGLTSNGGPEGKGTAYTIKTNGTGFGITRAFADWGNSPQGDLLRASDGSYYGLATNGGTYDHGTLFRITSTGAITILKHFNLATDGGYPKGSLIQGKDGNLYGTASSGGPNNGGVVFRISLAGLYTIVKSFHVNTDGGRPQCRLAQDATGNLYGTNNTGGLYGYGTLFRIGTAGDFSVLYHLNKADGTNPYGGLMRASDGNFYGMNNSGGLYSRGTIFRITPAGQYAVIHHFNSAGNDGLYPMGDLIQAKDGWLYGMTPTGGLNYNGTVFRINMAGTAYNIVRNLSAGVEGGSPNGRLVQASDGHFYGLAYSLSGSYSGSLFRVEANGNAAVVKRFTYTTDGGRPFGGLVQGSDGLLYGMTREGGRLGNGTIFKCNTGGTSFSVLAHLSGWDLGNEARGALALGKDSAYFGVGTSGGAYNNGTVFRICGGTTTVLKSFNRNLDGSRPAGSLVRAKDGNMYGVTSEGGANSGGTIFRITPTGGFAVIRHLTASTDGGLPKTGLTLGADSALYGMTTSGGTGGAGTVFRITTGGSFKVLRHLVAATDGSAAETGLTQGKDGFFYGMTHNKFFRISKDGVTFKVLSSFSYSMEGSEPFGHLIQSTDNNFYGTFRSGGTSTNGVIFRVTPNGVFTRLKSLTLATEGGYPKAGLVRGVSDTAFFGVTSMGGTGKGGTVFRITRTGTFTVLRHLNLDKDGGAALSALVVAPVINVSATPQAGLTTPEDVAKTITLAGTGATGLTYTIVTQPRNGTISSGTGASRSYKPKANFNGVDSFAFRTNLGCLPSAPAWVKITVTPVNDAPVLGAIGPRTVVRGTAVSFTATATDVDAGQTRTFSLVTPPAGAVINAATGAFSWTPTATGTFRLPVRVTDNGSPVLYDQDTVTITVTAPAVQATTTNAFRALPQEITAPQAALYPNPAAGPVTITLPAPAREVLVRIFDSRGTLVSAQNFKPNGATQIRTDVGFLRPGAYFVELQTATGAETIKMIKQ